MPCIPKPRNKRAECPGTVDPSKVNFSKSKLVTGGLFYLEPALNYRVSPQAKTYAHLYPGSFDIFSENPEEVEEGSVQEPEQPENPEENPENPEENSEEN